MKKRAQIKIIKANSQRHLVITPVFRISFPQLFQAKAFEDKGKKVFQLDMIFDSQEDFKVSYEGKKSQTVSMSKAVFNAKVDQWGKDKTKWPHFEYPVFKNGNERRDLETNEVLLGYEDKFFVTARSNEEYPPKILHKVGGRELTEDEIYGGCFARAKLLARPYISGRYQGVSFKLLAVLKDSDGERFGGFGGDFDTVEASEEDWDDSNSEESDEESEDF